MKLIRKKKMNKFQKVSLWRSQNNKIMRMSSQSKNKIKNWKIYNNK